MWGTAYTDLTALQICVIGLVALNMIGFNSDFTMTFFPMDQFFILPLYLLEE